MSEIPNYSENKKAEEIRSFTGGLASSYMRIGEVLQKDAVSRGEHRTKILKTPLTVGFGTFSRQWEYLAGCEPLTALTTQGVGEISVDMIDPEGVKKHISIGKTPSEWNPQNGGKTISEAGEPGEYLMAVAEVADGQKTVPATKFRYLEAADLLNVRLVNGGSFALAPNEARGRQYMSPGRIESTSAFLE